MTGTGAGLVMLLIETARDKALAVIVEVLFAGN
jgi:hypothetical protein